MTTLPSRELETFDNPAPERDFHIHMEVPEFVSLSEDRAAGLCNHRARLHCRSKVRGIEKPETLYVVLSK